MMADGYNHARAMRVAEIISDFRNLQHYMTQIQAQPSAEEYYLPGYTLLRACITEAQAVLASPYAHGASADPGGDLEREKAQLQAVILDAGTRRFQLQRCYLRAVAALRWINGRYQVLQGQQAHSGHRAQLQMVDVALQQELAAITDEHVEYSLRAQDTAQGEVARRRSFSHDNPVALAGELTSKLAAA